MVGSIPGAGHTPAEYAVPGRLPSPVPPGPWPAVQTHVPHPATAVWPRPIGWTPVQGTPYVLGLLPVPASTSGPAVGALIAGIVSILVALWATTIGLLGAAAGWGGWVAGAFGVLALLVGGAGALIGLLTLRRLPPATTGRPPVVRGRGLAVAGVSCGTAGVLLALLGVTATFALQLS